MIIMNIAEWIANILILGIASLLWVFAIFGAIIIISILNKIIKDKKL